MTAPGWEALVGSNAVVALRGDAPESVHAVVACVTDREGRPVLETAPGAAALPVFPRSAAKPFQALPSVGAGVIERLGLGARHLAVACASHSGGREPVALVEEVLAAAGVSEAALRCGLLTPLDADAAAELAARREPLRAVHHNCSGNHALGLVLCACEGWPLDDYLEPGHPLQAAMRDRVLGAAGAASEPEGVDGCGMRAYRLPLGALARAFGRLAGGGLGREGEEVATAMRAHPTLIWGAGGIDSALMAEVPGAVAKLGADGVVGVGLADGRGLALKVLDGARRALEPAAVAAVRAGLRIPASGPVLDGLAAPELRNASGAPAGRLEPRANFAPALGS
jgi:L-asparaginase II